MNMALAILQLYPQARLGVDFLVQDDGDARGQYIAKWSLEQPQPARSALEAAWELIKDKPEPKSEVELMKEENLQLNNQIIDLWETLLNAGVL